MAAKRPLEEVDLTRDSDDGDHAAAKNTRHRPSPPATSADLPLDVPLHLLAVRQGIPAWANEGFLGVRLSSLVSGTIQLAVISNYMIDLEWLLSACPALGSAARLMVLHGEKGARAAALTTTATNAGLMQPAGRTLIHAPPLPIPWGVHHSKAMLLQYRDGLRVIVFTANLIYCDCNNKAQGVYTQDFPLKDGASPATSDFERDLLSYCAQLGLPSAAAAALKAVVSLHDFSAARARLIASVPGYHKGDAMRVWGHPSLKAALNTAPGGFGSEFINAPLVAQFSSLGSLDAKWLGEEFTASAAAGHANGQRLGLPPPGPAGLKIVWPTVEEVQNSNEGWFAGCSIPGPTKNVTKPFLQPYYHRWGGEVTGRQRSMPHIKTFCRYEAQGKGLAWLLVASHNLSKAAWGEVQKGGTQLAIRHYELGALFLPGLEQAYLNSRWRGFCANPSSTNASPVAQHPTITKVKFVQWVRGTQQTGRLQDGGGMEVPLPVPYALPPHPYEREGAGKDVPWAVDGRWPGLDTWGRRSGEPRGMMYGLPDDVQWDAF